jgi:hypothetical protein
MTDMIWDEIDRRLSRASGALRVLRDAGHRFDPDIGSGIDLVAGELDFIRSILSEAIYGANSDDDSGAK